MNNVVYIVLERSYEYNDQYYYIMDGENGNNGVVYKVFDNKRDADIYCMQQNIKFWNNQNLENWEDQQYDMYFVLRQEVENKENKS